MGCATVAGGWHGRGRQKGMQGYDAWTSCTAKIPEATEATPSACGRLLRVSEDDDKTFSLYCRNYRNREKSKAYAAVFT